jgi:sulfur carrier protein
MVTVNGEAIPFIEGETLAQLIVRCGYKGGRIAAEVNGNIVPRAQHEGFIVKADDRIEIVGLIGGG